MNSIVPQLLLQVILIFLNAFFAAAEIAVISLNATKLRKSAEDGDKTCARLLKLVEEPSGFLSRLELHWPVSSAVRSRPTTFPVIW